MIQFVSDLRQGRWFSRGTPVSSTNKTDRNDITEILLKVALNTITLTLETFHTKNILIQTQNEITSEIVITCLLHVG